MAEANVAYESMTAPDMPWVGEGQRLGAEPLEAFFARVPRFAVAFSGGTDSAYLLAAALAAGCEVRAYLVNTAFQPTFELEDARAVAARLGVPLAVVEADVLAQDDICSNPSDRCRLCKRFIFGAIAEAAQRDGFTVLVDGTNASDDPARRPGFRALAEAGVVSPLRRAGMTKADVRAASRALALSQGWDAGAFLADKPRFSCLAVHAPAGERLTADALAETARRLGIGCDELPSRRARAICEGGRRAAEGGPPPSQR